MKKLAERGNQPLAWSQPKKFSRVYELRAGSDVVGNLRWDKTAEHEAVGETGDGQWTFGRKGFLKPQIIARPQGAAEPAAVLDVGWSGGGSLKLAGGPELRWLPSNFWRSQWVFAKPEGEALITFKPDSALLTAGSQIEIAAGASLEQLPLLAVLGWYVLVLILEDSAVIGI